MKSPNATLAALVATALLSVSAVFAQAPAAPIAASKAAPTAKAEKKTGAKPKKLFTAKTAKAKECSLKADEQNLHGKARQKFREECKKAA